jgi:hypothetical protein
MIIFLIYSEETQTRDHFSEKFFIGIWIISEILYQSINTVTIITAFLYSNFMNKN